MSKKFFLVLIGVLVIACAVVAFLIFSKPKATVPVQRVNQAVDTGIPGVQDMEQANNIRQAYDRWQKAAKNTTIPSTSSKK